MYTLALLRASSVFQELTRYLPSTYSVLAMDRWKRNRSSSLCPHGVPWDVGNKPEKKPVLMQCGKARSQDLSQELWEHRNALSVAGGWADKHGQEGLPYTHLR